MEKDFICPEWCGFSPSFNYKSKLRLEAIKGQQKLGTLDLQTKPFFVVGRHQSCDFVLEHTSISRRHSIILHNKYTGGVFIQDLDSTHGTFVDTKRILAGKLVLLTPSISRVSFGASTRVYSLVSDLVAGGKMQPKRRLDEGLDDDDDSPTDKKKQKSAVSFDTAGLQTQQLEENPSSQGKLDDLVESEFIPASDNLFGEASSVIGQKPISLKNRAKSLVRQPSRARHPPGLAPNIVPLKKTGSEEKIASTTTLYDSITVPASVVAVADDSTGRVPVKTDVLEKEQSLALSTKYDIDIFAIDK